MEIQTKQNMVQGFFKCWFFFFFYNVTNKIFNIKKKKKKDYIKNL